MSMEKCCGICMENQTVQVIFNKLKCSHTFCYNCIIKHIEAKVQANVTVIMCPEVSCKATLQPDIFQGIITPDLLDRWSRALCTSLYSGSKKMYCPFEDCSAMLLLDDEGGDGQLREAECPHCHRLFCAQCEVPCHFEMQCEEFSRMKKTKQDDERSAIDDQMFVSLAEKEKWRSCPNCKFYVEKIYGCLHIICVCGFEFCYGCGSEWDDHVECCVKEEEDSVELEELDFSLLISEEEEDSVELDFSLLLSEEEEDSVELEQLDFSLLISEEEEDSVELEQLDFSFLLSD